MCKTGGKREKSYRLPQAQPNIGKHSRDTGRLSQIDRFSLGLIEEGSKRGVTVLEGAGILARGTGSCT